jgi:CRP-like cAMP-binding protein
MHGADLAILQDGERTNPAGKPVANRILLSMPDAEYEVIRPHLEFVELPSHFSLHEPNEKLRFAYFLNGGLVSVVVATHQGREVEAGIIGREGVVGTALAVGVARIPFRMMMQIGGAGFRITGPALQSAIRRAPGLQMRMTRHAVLQGMQVAQTAACNRLHETRERLARWLLMAQDRVDRPSLRVTHDFLAIMLGTDRPSVSLAAAALQKNKVIVYNRGSVQILNRKKLEKSACECYRAMQQFNGELRLK